MTEFVEGDRVLVQLEATVTRTFEDGDARVDADGPEFGVTGREVIAVVTEAKV